MMEEHKENLEDSSQSSANLTLSENMVLHQRRKNERQLLDSLIRSDSYDSHKVNRCECKNAVDEDWRLEHS